MPVQRTPLTVDLVTTLCIMWLISGSTLAWGAVPSDAGHPIGQFDFSPNVVIDTFEGYGLGERQRTPLVLSTATFHTDDQIIRFAQFGPELGTGGFAIGNNTTLGYIDVQLHEPAYRAGLFYGLDWPWMATVSFFDTSNQLLGSIVESGSGAGKFAGWQAPKGRRIARILVEDTADPGHIIAIDNLYTESIPEPGHLFPFLVIALVIMRSRKFLSSRGG